MGLVNLFMVLLKALSKININRVIPRGTVGIKRDSFMESSINRKAFNFYFILVNIYLTISETLLNLAIDFKPIALFQNKYQT